MGTPSKVHQHRPTDDVAAREPSRPPVPPHEALAGHAAAVGNAQFARDVAPASARLQPVLPQGVARLARQPKPPAGNAPPPLDRHGDLSFALKYVDDYYERVRDTLNLKNIVQQQAIQNFEAFGKLKDPPSIADAVLGEIFNQVIGLVPGGKLVQAAIGMGVFASQLAALHKDLSDNPIAGLDPDKEVEATRQKGLGDKSKAKIEKGVEHAKTGIGAGKAVVDAGLKAAEERAAASAAEAAAKESAIMQGGRISDWRRATELAQTQEEAITSLLELAARKGTDAGRLKDVVVKRLGPLPKLSEAQEDQLRRQYELAYYRQALTLVTIRTRLIGPGGRSDGTSTSTRFETAAGAEVSHATRARIADLLNMPILAIYPDALAIRLGVSTTSRAKVEKTSTLESTFSKL